MFEQQSIIADRDAEFDAELHALESVLQPMSAPPMAPKHKGFQLPKNVWIAMLSCYAVFFSAIALATGGSGEARFMIVVSVLYAAIYFGVARIGIRQAGPEEASPLEHGKPLDTWTGLMDAKSVYGQVLIVPLAVALFGIGILVITAIVM